MPDILLKLGGLLLAVLWMVTCFGFWSLFIGLGMKDGILPAMCLSATVTVIVALLTAIAAGVNRKS